MYLSRLLLNPRSRQVQRETADPYQLHRTLLQAFDANRAKAGVLHRLDVDARSGRIILLVQSQAQPDWSRLPNPDYLLADDPSSGLDNPAVKTVNLPLTAGQMLTFRLRANPTVKKVRYDEAGKRLNSNRVPLVHEEKQLAWLAQKAEQSGFRLLQVTAGSQGNSRSWREGQSPLTLYTVQFDGRLQVQDPERLRQAVAQGIGPARAFGCGLLSLAPAG